MKRNFLIILLIVVIIGAIFAFNYIGNMDKNTENNPQEKIAVSGAWALYPMMVKWAEEYQKIHTNVKIEVSAGGAGKGMTDALSGLVDIGMVSREINPTEIEKGAFGIVVTKDAVVPTISKDNPVIEDLKVKGVKKSIFEGIYISESIKKWGEVVGSSATDDIHIFTRSDSCGAAETWAKYLGNKKQEDLKGVGVYGDPGVSEAVKNDPLGIGYNNVNYAYDSKTGKPIEGIAIIPIDVNENGKVDDEENFYSTRDDLVSAIDKNLYPSPPARELYIVTKDEFKGATLEFVKWILGDGQKYVLEAGYVPLSKERLTEQMNKL